MNNVFKIIAWVVVILVIIVGGYLLGNQPSSEDTTSPDTTAEETTNTDPIKIGFIGPLTGDVAFLGQTLKAALEIATEEINASDSLDPTIEIIYEDGQCDGGIVAVNAANKLINTDGVVAIIGGVCSAETLAIAPIAEAAGVPVISPGSTAPDVSDAGDFIFRIVPSDNFQGSYAAKLIYEDFGIQKVATMHCLADWCQGVTNAFTKTFTELGGEVVIAETYTRGDKDLNTQLTKIKRAQPELLYFAGYTAETVLAFQQREKLGLSGTPIFGADGWADEAIWEQLGELGNGALYTEPANQEVPQTFLDDMAAKGEENNIYATRAYDALYILANVLQQSTDRTGIKDTLYTVQNFDGIGDIYSFNEKGDIKNALYAVKEVQDGVVGLYEPEDTDSEESDE